MKILYEGQSNTQVVFTFKDSALIPSYLLNQEIFTGKEGDLFTEVSDGTISVWVGSGEKENQNYFELLKTGIIAAKQIKKIKGEKLTIDFKEQHQDQSFFLLEGFLLETLYQYSLKKEEKKTQLQELILKNINQANAERILKIVKVRNKIREWVDMPSNHLTTSIFADKIKDSLKSIPCQFDVWDKEKLEKENMIGLLSVGKGSANPPFLIQARYQPKNAKKKLVLVGKGITFDSGGLSLKPSDSMLDMKTDMAGAATVLGLIEIIHEFSLPIEIHAFMAIAENMISQNCYKIGDILTYRNGKSVEINNTDAEGRLILADALCLTEKIESDLIIDIATLTGACMVALGTDIYGVMSNNEKLSRDFCDFVNQKSSERAWPLPLYSKYKDNLKSTLADFKNTGKRFGGAITAALFLREFVPEDKKWMHLDIAGPSYDDGIGLFDSMATGTPLESLFLYLEKMDF